MLSGGRLHFQHGPIDLVLRAHGADTAVERAHAAAWMRFGTILDELVAELPNLRRPATERPCLRGATALRMQAATSHFGDLFVTPMAAVAGAVADEILAAMLRAAPLVKAWVNDGGDIALHLSGGERLVVGTAGDFSNGEIPHLDGHVGLDARDGVGGIATSGRHGRSFSLGIADSVTVLAGCAADADAAATLIANAVNCDSPAVTRRPACEFDPDSDLGGRLVTVDVGPLGEPEIRAALANGLAFACALQARGLIAAASLTLRGRTRVTPGGPFAPRSPCSSPRIHGTPSSPTRRIA